MNNITNLKSITASHLAFSTESDIREICMPWLSKFGLTFFDYARMYNDGSLIILSTDYRVIEYILYQEKKIIAPIPANLLAKKISYLIPYNGEYHDVMHFVATNFNLRQAIDLFECHENYVDVFCFGSDSKEAEMINLLLNKREEFEGFIHLFKEKTTPILNKFEKNKIYVPEHMQLNFNPAILYDQSRLLKEKYSHIAFTKGEIKCINKLILGHTAKEAGVLLNLSKRTIEYHVDNIKNKLGCNKKSDAIRILLKNKLNSLRMN